MMASVKGTAEVNPNARHDTREEVFSVDASPSGSQFDLPGTTKVKVEQQELTDSEDYEESHDETTEAAPTLKAVASANGEDPTTDTEAHLKEKDDNSS